jgi:glycosyltransferase involved in cell wall biosynthesis
VFVVPCGIQVDEFRDPPDGTEFRERRLHGYGGPLVLFLGRITDKKGVDVLIRSFAKVRESLECRLAIVGPDDSGLTPKLSGLARDVGLAAGEVTFVGPVFGEERLDALGAADVWALSSHTENFGIAVAEAAAAGCPLVISPAVNIAADVEAAGAGVVAEATPDAFASGLIEVLGDAAKQGELRQRGPAFAARYDWSVVTPQLMDMYRVAAGR